MDKIEEIRQKPEHERIRYVWIMVAISMIVIIFIWVVSFKSMFSGGEKTNSGNDPVTNLERAEKDGVLSEERNTNSQKVEKDNNLENTIK